MDSINAEQRLYVLRAGHGYSCLGFDVAERWRVGVLNWINGPRAAPAPAMEVGTAEHYAAYADAMAKGAAHAKATGKQCPIELTAQLVGLEGRRVEVMTPDGHKSRFWVGRSTGWRPCHLEIKTRASIGGCAAYVPEGSRVRVVEASR